MTLILACTKENNMILNQFFFFLYSGETLLTAGVVVSNYQNVTALNHLSLSLFLQLPNVPRQQHSTIIQGDHKETVREQANTDCVCVYVCVCASAFSAVSATKSRVCVEKLSAVDMSLEVVLQIYTTVRPH